MDMNTTGLDSNPGNTRLAGSISDIVGSTDPIEITTTEDVSGDRLPSETSEDEEPIGSTEQTTGSLDPQQIAPNGMEGYLKIVGPSDDGSISVKIASLGFPNDNTGHNPFELGPETELGSMMFLVPTPPPEVMPASLGPHVSNDTMTMFDARSVPLSVFSTYNTTSSSTYRAGSSSPTFEAKDTSSGATFVTVRLKADVSVHNSAVRENLCVTYNSDYIQIQEEPPLRLQRCDDSHAPGVPSAARDSSETQLWQYDPVTRELQPLISNAQAMGQPRLMTESLPTSSGAGTATSSAIMTVETAPPVSVGAKTASKAEERVGTSTGAPSGSLGISPPGVIRRSGNDGFVTPKVKPGRSNSPKPESAIQKQDILARSLVAVPVVDPYSLVFNSRSSVRKASGEISRPPA
ncbi:hypothetical protein FRC09_008323 [Ceratobasidium sp. 395]|nr:hypothetical protein FRC09_008323 [Ceratobasidium sp. 395]